MIIKENFELKDLCTFSIGGRAKFLCLIKTKTDLKEAISKARSENIKVHIHGGGSNTLYSDKDLDLLVIKMNNIGVNHNNDHLEVLSGTPWSYLLNYCLKNKLYGLEPLMGIPGSIGGAVYGNAGAHGMEIKDAIVEIECFDLESNEFINIDLENFDFKYRYSDFKKKKNLIIWSIKLACSSDSNSKNGSLEEYKNFRLEKQPQGKTTGSFFRNPENDSAGRLIEAAGLKGYVIGGIKSSEKHANFFINFNNATFKDVIDLKNLIQKRVFDEFGVNLIPEIITVE
ncbi:UDP-N-acetylmuramate dehydrogenase [bacterium]|jgi:UDP-N-acetylmuramate dehydrogenase|nr:UDP-N-acetylmuramate dehydrogenase [bacterium]MBT6293497.1 UDP-N-acetylmuramate dehydrogenase [bacterium]